MGEIEKRAKPGWIVLLSRAPEVTEREARKAGYRAYLARYRKLIHPHGHDRRPASILVPVFPGMLFVQDWRGFPKHVPFGECRPMPSFRGSEPARLSDADVSLIKAQEHAGAYDDIAYPVGPGMGAVVRREFDIGQEVEFTALGRRVAGALEGLSDNGKAFVRTAFGRVETEAEALTVVGCHEPA